MHGLLEKIKAHPYIAAAIVFAVGILLIIFFAGGSKAPEQATTLGPDPNAVQAATALAAHQIDAQSAALGIAASESVANKQTDAQLTATLAGISANTNNATLQADLAKTLGLAGLDTQSKISVLQTQIAQKTLDTQTAIAKLQTGVQTTSITEQTKQIAAMIAGQTAQSTSLTNALIDQQHQQTIQKQLDDQYWETAVYQVAKFAAP